MRSFHITFCGEMKHVMREGVLNVHNSHLWAWKNPSAIHEHVYQVYLSISVRATITGDTVMGLLPGRLIPQGYSDLLESILLGLFKVAPLAVRQSFWFQHDGAPENCGEDVWEWLKTTNPGRSTDGESLLHDLLVHWP
jgi:hypothetical protein